ncbi:MAG TPA: biosynthetic peptidoglycan transglycosylase [Adhaeribacter sp.]|nr:biosynthetic peptidoglycan transglycosylase [Adhaeribacter sp.]
MPQININKELLIRRSLQIGLGFLILLTLILGGLLLFRQRLLKFAVATVEEKVEARYPVDLRIGKYGFDNLNTVSMEQISVKPAQGDTLLRTSKVTASVSIRTLLKGRLIFNELQVSDAFLTAEKYPDGSNNYSFLIKKDTTAVADTTKSRNYGALLNTLIERTFESVPDKVDFKNLNVSYISEDRKIVMRMPEMKIKDGEINTDLRIRTDSLVNNMQVQGIIKPAKYFISARLYAKDTSGIHLPYVKQKFGGTVSFDTLHVSLTEKNFKRGTNTLTVTGDASVTGLTVNHSRIADKDIQVKSGAIHYVASLGPDYYAIDTLTEVRVNKMKLYPVVQLKTKPYREVTMRVHSAKTPANDFFSSLPEGMFETLEGIKAEGALSYKMNFHVNMNELKNVKFDSDLDGHDLKIVEWGNEDLTKINKPFVYTAYEYGKPVRDILVGPKNGFFAPYHSISPYLRNTILTSEDAGFFRHKGFHEEAFRQSIAANIKARKFVRGGSTISMQLVKNVFLSRKKTVARKVEEALIVWLIENLRLSTKTRMYEVYLNIIEWGPNVYGIKDASRFYFGKQPSELTLAESIYLAHIIPKPKAYKSAFDASGNLKPHVAWYYKLISGIMVRRGLISQEDYDNLQPNVALYGRARDLIVKEPVAPPDSLKLSPIDIFD